VLPPGPVGPGTAAARPVGPRGLYDHSGAARLRRHAHVPFQKVGPSRIPDFHLPFETTHSPHLDAARRGLSGWAAEVGITREGIWDESDLIAYDLPLCAAGIRPEATPEELDTSSMWLTWGTYADDYFPAVFGHRRDLAAAKLQHERFRLFMPIEFGGADRADESAGGAGRATTAWSGGFTPFAGPAVGTAEVPAVPANAMERALADVWLRTAAPMTDEARRELRTAVEEMTASWLWELHNQAQHRVPDPVDYIEMRRHTFGSHLTMLLARLGQGRRIRPEVHRSAPLQNLEHAAADFAALLNDVFSYQKEIEYEGEVHNCLLVVQNFFNCDYPTALAMVNDLMTARMRQFEHVVAHELPVLYEDHALPADERAAIEGYVRELQHWMAAIRIWHRDCHRYGAEDLRHRIRPRPPARVPGAARGLAGTSGTPGTPGTPGVPGRYGTGLPSGVGMAAACIPLPGLSS
ncbi:hypothetical protein GUY61_28125, partial [Streptomyces sp. GC420]|nr:hypothetical protein [Streptomyces sp. GC420]